MSCQTYFRGVNVFEMFPDVNPVYAVGGRCRKLMCVHGEYPVGISVVSKDGCAVRVFDDLSNDVRRLLPVGSMVSDFYAYDFGDALRISFPFSYVSGHEMPFDLSGEPCWFSYDELREACDVAIEGITYLSSRKCFMFATSMFLNLVGGGKFSSVDMPYFCSVREDECFTPWLSDMLYRLCGRNLCTEICALTDGKRLLELLNDGYAIMLMFPSFYTIPFLSDWSDNMPAHVACIVPLGQNRFVYVDNGHVQFLREAEILSLTLLNPDKRLVSRGCYHGSMVVGARRFGGLT